VIILDPWFYAVAIPAVVLTGISKAGFGGAVGSLAVPMLSLAIAPPQAVAIMLPILLAMDAMGLATFRGRVDRAILRWTVPAGLLGTLLGWALFRLIDDRWIRGLVGVEAVVFGAQKLLEGSRAWTGEPRAAHWRPAVFWSALAGFTSFISHAGGPPMMRFMLPLRLHQEILVGTLAWYFAAINASKLLPYGQLGLLDWTNLGTSLALLPVVPVGYLIGLRFLKVVKPAVFVRVASVALVLTGVKLLWDALA